MPTSHLLTPLKRAFRLEMPQRKTESRKTLSPCLNLVQNIIVARSNSNTVQMILLPSHTTHSAFFVLMHSG